MDNLIRTIDAAVANQDYATLQSVFQAHSGLWSTVGQGEQRSVAAHFIVKVVSEESNFFTNNNKSTVIPQLMDCFVTALGHLPAAVENAADNQLRKILFAFLVEESNDYIGAARILAGTRMEDTGVYAMTPADKADVYVKIAECFLAEDETAESDAAVNKAGIFIEQIGSNKEPHYALLLRYKSTLARVLDSNRKFLNAAKRYHELSQSKFIDNDEMHQFLGRAVTCAILAPAGPQKQRVLAQIAQDDRLFQLDGLDEFSTHRTLLRKIYTHQIVIKDSKDLVTFEKSLQEHQKALMGDGLSILERGIVEHNMIAVSQLYESIYFSELAHILGVSNSKAESIAASMIMDGSLPQASMDQVAGLLEFATPDSSDRALTEFCMELNAVAKKIQATG